MEIAPSSSKSCTPAPGGFRLPCLESGSGVSGRGDWVPLRSSSISRCILNIELVEGAKSVERGMIASADLKEVAATRTRLGVAVAKSKHQDAMRIHKQVLVAPIRQPLWLCPTWQD